MSAMMESMDIWTLRCKAPKLPPIWGQFGLCDFEEVYRPRPTAPLRFVLTRMAESMRRHNSAGHHGGWVGSFQFSLDRRDEVLP